MIIRRMFIRLALGALAMTLGVTCSVNEEGGEGTYEYLDERDQVVYHLIKVGTQVWFGSDLKYAMPNSFCYDNIPVNCEEYGRLYNYEEAKKACPSGWKLPNEQDWQQLEAALGMPENELDSIRVWRGAGVSNQMIDRLKIQFSGVGKPSGKDFFGMDQLVYYWVDEVGPSGNQFSLYRMLQKNNDKVYKDQIPKMSLACVRCVKQLPSRK